MVTRLVTGKRSELDAVNLDRDNGLILYTPHYASSTPRAEGQVEAVLRVDQPIGVVPLPRYATRDRRRCARQRRGHPSPV